MRPWQVSSHATEPQQKHERRSDLPSRRHGRLGVGRGHRRGATARGRHREGGSRQRPSGPVHLNFSEIPRRSDTKATNSSSKRGTRSCSTSSAASSTCWLTAWRGTATRRWRVTRIGAAHACSTWAAASATALFASPAAWAPKARRSVWIALGTSLIGPTATPCRRAPTTPPSSSRTFSATTCAGRMTAGMTAFEIAELIASVDPGFGALAPLLRPQPSIPC